MERVNRLVGAGGSGEVGGGATGTSGPRPRKRRGSAQVRFSRPIPCCFTTARGRGEREENRRRRIQPREDTLRRVYVASRHDTPSLSVCVSFPSSSTPSPLSILLVFDRFRSLGNVRRVAAVPSASRYGRAISVSGFRVAVHCMRAHFSPVPVAVAVRCALFTRVCVRACGLPR